MTREKVRGNLITLFAVILATFLFAVAVNCYIHAALGSDSVSVFQQGLSVAFGCSLGIAAYIYIGLILLVDLFIARKNIGWTTILNALLLGGFIDLVRHLLQPVFQNADTLAWHCVLLVCAILLVAISCVILIRFRKGMNALDAVAWGLSDRLKLPYRVVRISVDAILMLTGWLLGGVVGYGSIAAVVLTGPLIQFINNKCFKKK